MELFKTLEAAFWLMVFATAIGTIFGLGWILLALIVTGAVCLGVLGFQAHQARRSDLETRRIARQGLYGSRYK